MACEHWDGADYMLPGNEDLGGIIPALAVNVEVTGRKSHQIPGMTGVYGTRVRVTFVGDCEPDVTVPGWRLDMHPLMDDGRWQS